MPELLEALTLLVQGLVLTAANYLLVLYLTDTTIKGPANIFERIRSLAGIKKSVLYNLETEQDEVAYVVRDRFWAKVLDCHRCSSPYGAIILILLSWVVGFVEPDPSSLILWLAVSGTTVLLHE